MLGGTILLISILVQLRAACFGFQDSMMTRMIRAAIVTGQANMTENTHKYEISENN